MKISITWMNTEGGTEYKDEFVVAAPLSAVKVIVLASTGWASPSDEGQYIVTTRPGGDPLDETKSLEDHGITDGATLYLTKA